MWSEIIYKKTYHLVQNRIPDQRKYKKLLTYPIAEGLYKDLQKAIYHLNASDTPGKNFGDLSKKEKAFWYDYAAEIPDKLKALNIFIRPFRDFCRTCIITDDELSALVRADNERFLNDKEPDDLKSRNIKIIYSKSHIVPGYFEGLTEDWNRFFKDLNYLIPVQLKKNGYEVIRYEEVAEINLAVVKKIARAIHSRYLQELRNQIKREESSVRSDPGANQNQYSSDYDDLPDEIKNSNTDSAYHIPAKLLSIGYRIRHVKKGFKPVALHLNEEEIETMSRLEHLRWSWEKRLNGWIFGSAKDDNRKTHPSLISYEELSETEKDKDRHLVKLIPAILQDIKYEVYPVSPGRINIFSYAIKPQGSIQKILDETRELNDQIRKLVTLTPEVEEMVSIRNKKIEEAINEVKESYNYAEHIQKTFLPDNHYVRECFPDSFVLFKPKDIVSGDFYFFSRQKHLIIFAAADCTGHGIPGALLSTLGYGILDQAVNEIRLTDPSYILHNLYSKIHRFLRNDSEGTGLSDDMDIILSVLDTNTNILTFSSVKNPLYRITKGEMVVYCAKNVLAECIENDECQFTAEKIQLNIGDTIYLSTDGFTDQFGGRHHKKYQTARFGVFLKSLQEYSLPEQSDRLYKELEYWMEENSEDQTDDILVIGIRI